MKITTEAVKKLRGDSGAGIMECRNALVEVQGDIEEALQILKERGLLKAKKKEHRTAANGLIEAYVHIGGRLGTLVEVNCETDFVSRTDEFKELAHNLAMQVAATSPQFISKEEVPEEADIDIQKDCLLLQPYIKDPDKTVQDIITETITKVGENIKVGRFAMFELDR
jgi:elongation factor Ts